MNFFNKVFSFFWYKERTFALLKQNNKEAPLNNNKTNKKTITIMAEVMENMHHEYATKGKANAGLTLGRQD